MPSGRGDCMYFLYLMYLKPPRRPAAALTTSESTQALISSVVEVEIHVLWSQRELPEDMKEAIKDAGVKFVNRDSSMEGEERKQHYIHGVPVGPTSEGIAKMVLLDAIDKAKSLKRITLLPVQGAMVVLRKTASALMNYITRCCTPYEAKAATEHFDEEVLKYLCEIQRIMQKG